MSSYSCKSLKMFLILTRITAYKKQRTTLCDANMIFGLILEKTQPCVLIRLLSGYEFYPFIKHVTQRHLSFLYSVT